jgi:diguanylate cyclase (GGDEF)-like protein/PAS domain S-box-containing protein
MAVIPRSKDREPAPPSAGPLGGLLDGLPTAVFACREHFVYTNAAAGTLTGYGEDELSARSLPDLARPEDRTAVADWLREGCAGSPSRLAFWLRHRDGHDLWVECEAAAVPFDDAPAVVGTLIDATRRRQVEDELREGRRRLDLAQRAARYVAWEWDVASDELIVNGDAGEIFGLPAHLVGPTGEAFLRHLHPADRERFAAATRMALKGERDLAVEIRVVPPGGRVRWLSERGMVIRDTEGWGIKMIGVATDVTERKQAEFALRESEDRYRQMFELHRAVKLLIDPGDGRIVDASPSAAQFYGYSVDELREMRISEINTLPPEQIEGELDAALEGSRDLFLFRHRLASGEIRDVEVESCPVAAGGRTILYSIIHDVTERRRAEQALYEEKERAQVTLASIGDGVIRTDAEGRVDYLNPVAEKLTGWPLGDARRRPLTEVYRAVDGATGKPLLNPVAACLRGEPWVDLPGYPMLVRKDGAQVPVQDSAAPIRDRSGAINGAVLVFKDMSELHGMEREMSYLATHDPLTGLLNRSELEGRLAARLAAVRERGGEHALCYLDLDEFKVINDTCGHLAGDDLLKQVAGLLKQAVGVDDVVARLGGDEFGVLLSAVDAARARATAERLLAVVHGFRFVWRERMFEIGASIGLVPITGESGDLAQVLAAADAACYVAKERGRNRIHEYQPDDRALAERHGEMQWIHRIHKAFDERRFCLYRQRIQPLGGIESRPPLAEVFIRMRSEDGGLTTPDAFIPAAERYHLAPSIDRWVVHTALTTLARRFGSAGDDGATAYTINLSGQSLGDESFLEYVVAELNASGLAPERVCFEITETAAIAHLARAARFISVLKEMGCRFVLDDFGSGLSSFAYLKNLQVDFLKIAGEFVREMADDDVQRALVSAIQQVGRVMKIHTIAESVEDRRTLAALEEIGVDYAQGFLLGRPEPL